MKPARPLAPTEVRRILLVRPRFIGDICLTLPVLDALRALCPDARIAYLVECDSAPLLEGDPRVDELIVARRSSGPLGNLKVVQRVRRFRPELVFDFFANPRTALWSALSGARVRVGYPNKGWRSSLYTHHTRPRTLSAIGFHLASLEAIGWGDPARPWSGGSAVTAPAPEPRLHVSDERRADARLALRELGVPEGAELVGFHPGARWPTRRWGAANFAELAGACLEARPEAVAVVSAGPGEEGAAREVVHALGARACPVLGWPLARLVALQSMCRAFVCGDSGPMHTAVAAGTPTLGILSRNRPAMFFPYSPANGHRAYYARVECSPCHRDECADLRCLRRLTSAGAWEILQEMLGPAAARGPTS
ncbi:MAG: glycosyltransferase family 9 protein [Candidatus Eisenbacteria bacterium]